MIDKNDVDSIYNAVSSIPKFGVDIHIGDAVISSGGEVIYRLRGVNKNNILCFESENRETLYLDILSFTIVHDKGTGTSKVVHRGGRYNFYKSCDIPVVKDEDSWSVPPISKDWFTEEWRLNADGSSYRFRVKSIEYTNKGIKVGISGAICGKVAYDKFIETFHMIKDE